MMHPIVWWNRIACLLVPLWLCSTTTVANAQLVVVANQDAPVAALSMDEVRQIFLGRLQLFPASNTSIQVIDQSESSPVFAKFYEQVARKSAMQITRYRAGFLFGGRGRLPKVVKGDLAVLGALNKQVAAIGYVERESIAGHPVKILFVLP